MSHNVDSSPLGKETDYPDRYDASLLCAIDRTDGRAAIDINENEALPFKGVDYWNAFEVSWLNSKGKPVVGVVELSVPCDSRYIVESKSLKLYFNSLNLHRFNSTNAVIDSISNDLDKVVDAAVDIKLHTDIDHEEHFKVSLLKGECLDGLDIEVDQFDIDSDVLCCEAKEQHVSETLYSHLLRSNCPVTGQPDWASVMVRYEGKKIDREALLRYIISYRTHNEFHEQCVERMFMDIKKHCAPQRLTVYARYTRRGGIDINPFRSDFELPHANLRLLRQ